MKDDFYLKYITMTTLTHSFPMHPFSTPWKHEKTVRFSDVFREQRKGALGTNGLNRNKVNDQKISRLFCLLQCFFLKKTIFCICKKFFENVPLKGCAFFCFYWLFLFVSPVLAVSTLLWLVNLIVPKYQDKFFFEVVIGL